MQPPPIPPAKGIELIQRQIAAGKQLMAQSNLDGNAYSAWKKHDRQLPDQGLR